MRISRILAALFAVVVLIMAINPLTVSAASTETKTETKTIELETYSALLIDKSGSANKIEAVETIVGQYDFASYDVVVPFDHRISTNPEFTGGGNSHICEVIDQLVDSGFTHITVITDGEQWPEDYSALGVYTNVDLTIHLVEEDEESEQFINQLKSRLVNSDLKVTKPDGTEEMILNGYKKPIYSIEVPVIEDKPSEDEDKALPDDGEDNSSENVEDEDNVFIENIKEGYIPWWIILLIFLIPAIYDIIHELITRRRSKDEDEDDTTDSTKPTMSSETVAVVAKKLGEGNVEYYVDNSTSFERVFHGAAEAALQSGIKRATTFGSEVKRRDVAELHGLTAQNQTKGWEAIETTKGGKNGVILSDMHFNGKAFDEKAFTGKHFRKITVFAPKGYNVANVENLKKIADEVEVLPLQ